jgi:predicted DNA binding CopG/RHH family protein
VVTPLRNIRVSDALWDAAKRRAAKEGVTVTDVLLNALKMYVAKK